MNGVTTSSELVIPSHGQQSARIGDATFDYGMLDTETAAYVWSRATTILARGQRLVADAIGIGKDLRDAKELLPHGLFESWIESEFLMPVRTARNYMRLAATFGDRDSATLAGSELTALHLLASPSTPDNVRAEFIDQAERGEPITVRDVRDALNDGTSPQRRSRVNHPGHITNLADAVSILYLIAPTSVRVDELRTSLEDFPEPDQYEAAATIADWGRAFLAVTSQWLEGEEMD